MIDLKKKLVNRRSIYESLEIAKQLPLSERHKLIKELIFVYLFNNISNAHLAK